MAAIPARRANSIDELERAGEHLPAAVDWSQARELVISFLKLTRTARFDIARQLGLSDGLADMDQAEVANEILRRVRNANKIVELAERLNCRVDFLAR